MHLKGSESPLRVLDAFRELHHLLRRLQPRIQVVRSPQRVMPHAQGVDQRRRIVEPSCHLDRIARQLDRSRALVRP